MCPDCDDGEKAREYVLAGKQGTRTVDGTFLSALSNLKVQLIPKNAVPPMLTGNTMHHSFLLT